MSKQSKRMRLPNGFGQISELKGRRLRQPFRAMVTIGTKENGRPICKVLSYHKTYNEAYSALMEYHKNPYDLSENLTIEELYNRWFEKHKSKISESWSRSVTSTWKHLNGLYKMPVRECKISDLKNYLENCTKSEVTKDRMKLILDQIFDFAMEYEMIPKNPARAFKLEIDHETKNHLAFTEDEISILWKNLDLPGVSSILVMIYSGWRPSELINLKKENINLEVGYMTGGSKTKAGKNRIVPIHPKISTILIPCLDSMDKEYRTFIRRFKDVCSKLNINSGHLPHDGRKTFITLAKKYQLDEYAIKRIVGHAINDLTEDVYTERSVEWLISEIVKIP